MTLRNAITSTSATALLGTSPILPIVFPVIWESRGRTYYLITSKATKRYLPYKVLQAYLQGSSRAVYHCLPQEASCLILLLEACRFRHPLGSPHWPSQDWAKENPEAWSWPSPPYLEHSYLECSGASPTPIGKLSGSQPPRSHTGLHLCKDKVVKNY